MRIFVRISTQWYTAGEKEVRCVPKLHPHTFLFQLKSETKVGVGSHLKQDLSLASLREHGISSQGDLGALFPQ